MRLLFASTAACTCSMPVTFGWNLPSVKPSDSWACASSACTRSLPKSATIRTHLSMGTCQKATYCTTYLQTLFRLRQLLWIVWPGLSRWMKIILGRRAGWRDVLRRPLWCNVSSNAHFQSHMRTGMKLATWRGNSSRKSAWVVVWGQRWGYEVPESDFACHSGLYPNSRNLRFWKT